VVHHVQQRVLLSQLVDGDDVRKAQARVRVKAIKTIMRRTALIIVMEVVLCLWRG
jgi:hypothetical protein